MYKTKRTSGPSSVIQRARLKPSASIAVGMLKPHFSKAEFFTRTPFPRFFPPNRRRFPGDYNASDYERLQHHDSDNRGPFDLDTDRLALDNSYMPRDYSPTHPMDEVGEEDFWSRRQHNYVYRRREASPRRILAGDYDGYWARDGEEYRRYREGRGRIMSRDFSRHWALGSFLPGSSTR